MTDFLKKKIPWTAGALATIGIALWLLAHIPGILYGTYDVPLHQSYIGDEQSAVNGALHMLSAHSIFGFRNVHTLYYGPLFVIIDTPAVLIDFASKWAQGLVHSAVGYQNYILYDWGGIVFWLHVTATLSCLLGLWAVWALMATRTMNPSGRKSLPWLSTVLVAINFYYFEYSHFAKHWAFILPLFFLQAYCLVRIAETNGERRSFWIVHALATIAVWGISYFAVIFTVMWIPWLWSAFARRDWVNLRRFVLYAAAMAVGFLVVVLWDPYPFFRNFSFLGVGTPQGGIGAAQNPLAFDGNSLGWYGIEIVLNDLALAIAFVVAGVALWVKIGAKAVGKSAPLWLLLCPAIIGYLFFGLASHHEGRYMLPTIAFLILAFGYLASLYAREFCRKGSAKGEIAPRFTSRPSLSSVVTTALVALVACYAAFQVAADLEWMIVYGQGPLEKAGIADAFQLQKTGAPVLMVQDYIAGAVHDKASYAAYIGKRGRDDTNLYQALMAADVPPGLPQLDVRYAYPWEFAADPRIAKAYAHVVLKVIPVPGLINQFDYFDEDVMRLWYYDDLSPHWVVLK